MRRLSSLLAIALTLLAPALASAQPFHLADGLRGSTSGDASGGTFGADGWTVTGPSDRIWYALPRLVSGSIEFTLAHVTTSNLPLADHEIFAMYEDGYGIGEPIAYLPAFRGNHYKMLLRIYGDVEPGRVGAMKMMWGMCPSGAPGYDGCGCTSFFEEPFANPGPWTGDPVRIRVEWGGGQARLLRDGAEVVAVDWSSSGLEFGPSDLHMMIGSPRNDGGLAAMPIGATFSDLVVDGTQGALAMCPGGIDAGMPMDAGTCSSAGAAIADSTAAIWEPGPFPDPSDLNVEGDASGPTALAYLRFPAATGVVTHATLTMHTSSSGSAAGGSGQVCAVTGASWDESTLTWTNRPAVSATCSGGAHTVAANETVSWDVTSLVAAGGPIDLAIVSANPDGAHYLSRESGGCSLGPTLDVTVTPGTDGGPRDDAATPGMDGGGSSTDAAAGLDARAGADTGTRGGGLAAGCGCRASGGAPRLAPVVLALLAMLGARRRRDRGAREPGARTSRRSTGQRSLGPPRCRSCSASSRSTSCIARRSW